MQEEVVPLPPDAPQESPSGRSTALRIAGLAVIAFGLSSIIAGLLLGAWDYNSPIERGIRDATLQAVNGLSGSELDGGVVLTAEPFTPPGLGEYVLAQPPTLIGGIVVFVGFMLLAMSASGDATAVDVTTDSHPDPPPAEPSTPGDNDSIFDTGD